MALPEPFHGPHVEPLAAERLAIEWRRPTPRCARIRVKEHTCECQGTLYELCQAGGLRFIRRSIRKGRRAMVSETIWMPSAKTERLWRLLLAGGVADSGLRRENSGRSDDRPSADRWPVESGRGDSSKVAGQPTVSPAGRRPD
ncbi:hypothetical protein Misp02_23320 [Microtetraspora sp. NBRC 16547]|nr:hypothetical protein Misp02_23320 [Microtetraspora sp. NBRC 16547]